MSDTQQHSPPAGDYAGPIPMHVHSVSAEAAVALGALGGAGQDRALVTRFGTETVDDINPVRPLLPASPGRVCAYLQVSGGDVYLADSQAKALQAADSASSFEGALLPSANTAPWPVRGQGAVWVAQAVAAKTCVISYTADYRE